MAPGFRRARPNYRNTWGVKEQMEDFFISAPLTQINKILKTKQNKTTVLYHGAVYVNEVLSNPNNWISAPSLGTYRGTHLFNGLDGDLHGSQFQAFPFTLKQAQTALYLTMITHTCIFQMKDYSLLFSSS